MIISRLSHLSAKRPVERVQWTETGENGVNGPLAVSRVDMEISQETENVIHRLHGTEE